MQFSEQISEFQEKLCTGGFEEFKDSICRERRVNKNVLIYGYIDETIPAEMGKGETATSRAVILPSLLVSDIFYLKVPQKILLNIAEI